MKYFSRSPPAIGGLTSGRCVKAKDMRTPFAV